MGVDTSNLRRIVAASAAGIAALQGATAVKALRDGRRDYVDPIWGPGLGVAAVTSAALGSGDPVRRWTLAAVTSAWAARLAKHTLASVRSKDEEDQRYTEYLGDAGPAEVVRKVFVTQGVAQLLVSAPIQLAAASTLPASARRWLFPAGIALMVAGTAIEATADRQKEAFMARDRDERPDVLDTGLWAYSRHPNYFGDSCVWVGAWVASAASPPAWTTLPAPAAMCYFLVFATGAKRTERRMQDRPAFQDYQRRVSFFVPLPPKKG
ncbi:DUF1295 domain-containing protein [Nocardioides lentus]|uniref:DUF1295 domain-containing protein n=1 Tax=Nocardioides lentus TaxID=338077 RepID=A0ABN2PAJ6_9ACTN